MQPNSHRWRLRFPRRSVLHLAQREMDLPGHSSPQITEMYYVKRDNSRLVGATDEFEL